MSIRLLGNLSVVCERCESKSEFNNIEIKETESITFQCDKCKGNSFYSFVVLTHPLTTKALSFQ